MVGHIWLLKIGAEANPSRVLGFRSGGPRSHRKKKRETKRRFVSLVLKRRRETEDHGDLLVTGIAHRQGQHAEIAPHHREVAPPAPAALITVKIDEVSVVMSNLKKSNSDNMFPYDGSSDSLYDEPMMSIHALLDCIWDGKKTTLETILM
ncbi:hypothetical protein MRB53_001768 [Persea americana]|uniref:Uncharacterized protein n=1 Tax=Persea americana TaxID=3435 RepID=A0ACC2MSN0_PERAE|nr:hypothetical protein MRB53_001768 [Persea americana]